MEKKMWHHIWHQSAVEDRKQGLRCHAGNKSEDLLCGDTQVELVAEPICQANPSVGDVEQLSS